MRGFLEFSKLTLRVQVPNNHILTQNLYQNYYYPKLKYPILGYLDCRCLKLGLRASGFISALRLFLDPSLALLRIQRSAVFHALGLWRFGSRA